MGKTLFAILAPSLLVLQSINLTHAQSCYYPDGSIAHPDQPCSSDGVSACCGFGFACLRNGVCQITKNAPDINSEDDLNPYSSEVLAQARPGRVPVALNSV
jgi:hypothetical protein